MLINNKTLLLEQRDVEIRPGVTIKVSALPAGVYKDYEKVFARPAVPVTTTQKVNGPAIITENWNDPEYIKKAQEWSELQSVFLFYYAIKNDSNIKIDNIPTDEASLKAFFQEVKSSGLTDGDLAITMKIVLRLSRLDKESLEDAKLNF